jgi:predicted RNA-binding Zn-ribbon protein involved in translation (DUF1610 family)
MSQPNLDNPVYEKQTHCYTCGQAFKDIKYQCPICGEWTCSEECRRKHIKRMNSI